MHKALLVGQVGEGVSCRHHDAAHLGFPFGLRHIEGKDNKRGEISGGYQSEALEPSRQSRPIYRLASGNDKQQQQQQQTHSPEVTQLFPRLTGVKFAMRPTPLKSFQKVTEPE